MSEFSRALQLQLYGLADATSYEHNRRTTNSFRRQRFNDLPGGRSYPLIDRNETAVKVDSPEKLIQIVNEVKQKTKDFLMAGQKMSEAAAESLVAGMGTFIDIIIPDGEGKDAANPAAFYREKLINASLNESKILLTAQRNILQGGRRLHRGIGSYARKVGPAAHFTYELNKNDPFYVVVKRIK
jgi:hypothetical protein